VYKIQEVSMFLKSFVACLRTAFSHFPQMITATSTNVRNSNVTEVCGLRFAEVISAITEPMYLSLSS